ncbi:MAG TPA: M28 family peptidase [Gemmatimonadaceae bacterium]|nr:M28 family peptidase [Gemmatimonadaceae bacterium]
MHTHLKRVALAALLPIAACAPRGTSTGAAPAPTPAAPAPDPFTPAARVHAPRPTTAAITAEDLRTRLYIFADDSMQGREAGTPGNVKGTDYIASEIRKMGLVPAGDGGTYFQTIPLKTRSISDAIAFTVNGSALKPFEDFLPVTDHAMSNNSLQVVYGGVLGDSANRVSPDQARGKLLVFSLPTGAGMAALRGMRRSPIEGLDPAVVAVMGLDVLPPQVVGYFREPRTFLDEGDDGSSRTTLYISEAAAAKLFPSPVTQLQPGATGATVALNVAYDVKPVEFPARNVVGIIPGSDPKLKGEYVAIGAHNDHVGYRDSAVDHDSLRIWNHIVRPEGADDGDKQATPAQQAQVNQELAAFRAKYPQSARRDSINNGADDDGSGSVSTLEIAQKISSMQVKPKRSILFVWHVGEEKGLLGSRWFTDHPTVPRDSIVAQLNMDMIGRGGANDETGRTKDGTPIHGGPDYLQLVGSRRLSTELGDIVEQVNTEGNHNLKFDYSIDADGHPANIYCRSDHYEYARYGIPITFFTTGLHSDYHQVSDEPQYIDYEHMSRVANLVEDIALHVADLDHRVVVDHPKPDPNGVCRQ